MIKIVITGSIGMGKSQTARFFEKKGFLIYDADKIVHQLYQKNGAAVAPISKVFPKAIENGQVNRATLSQIIVKDSQKIKQIEAIVHPLTREKQKEFLAQAQKSNALGVVFDIPLFFESGGDKTKMADYVVVVSAPYALQKQRALERKDMNSEKFEAIYQRQMKDSQKRARADFVIETQYGFDYAEKKVDDIIRQITKKS